MNAHYTNRSNATQNAATRNTILAALVTMTIAATAAAQPEMVVRFDGSEIANHTELTFDDTPVGGSRQLVVTLRNESAETLFFTEAPPVIMAGGFPESFSLIQPALEAGNTLSPNGSTAFAIRFEPTIAFNRLFSHLYIWTNDDSTPFHIIVSGRSVGPQMIVRHEGVVIPDLGLVEFPDTEIGETSEITLTIDNQGGAPLQLTSDPRADIFGGFAFDFAVTQQPDTTIDPGQTSEVRIAFTPTLERLYSTRLFIHVNENSATVNTLYDIDILAQSFAPAVEEDPNQPDAGDPDPDDPDNNGNDDPDGNNDPDNTGDQTGDEGLDNPDNANDDLNDTGNNVDDQVKQDDPTQGDLDEDLLLGSPVPTCGFGLGFASLMGMVSLGGIRKYGIRPIK
jgi:hypothetical protein